MDNSWDHAIKKLRQATGYVAIAKFTPNYAKVICTIEDRKGDVFCEFVVREEHAVQFIILACIDAIQEIEQ